MMPRKRGETNEQWMQRLRDHRMMDRTRAAVGFINGPGNGRDDLKMSAFLDIFHPELSAEQRLELVQSARRR